MYGAAECPKRAAFVRLARRQGIDRFRTWLTGVTGAEHLDLHAERGNLVRAALTVWLDRLGLYYRVQGLRLPPGPAVGATEVTADAGAHARMTSP